MLHAHRLGPGSAMPTRQRFWSVWYPCLWHRSLKSQPMEIRATGISLGFAMLNGIIIMLVQVTPIAVDAISWRFFLIFVFMDVIFLIVFYFMYPETARIPLEEVG